MTWKTKATVIASLLAVAAILPITGHAVDQADIEIAAKERLQEMIDKLHADIAKTDNPEELERLDKLLSSATDFKSATDIAEQLAVAATADEQKQLLADLKEVEAKLREHAGNRSTHTVIVPEGQNPPAQKNGHSGDAYAQSALMPAAYANNAHLNDFEFAKEYDFCYSGSYDLELSGILDTSDDSMSVNWGFPARMYVTNLDDDDIASCVYVDYDQADFFHYGYDNDGTYYCGLTMPGYNFGAISYPCPYADPGELNYMFVTVDYEGDDSDNDRDIRLHPWIRFMILG